MSECMDVLHTHTHAHTTFTVLSNIYSQKYIKTLWFNIIKVEVESVYSSHLLTIITVIIRTSPKLEKDMGGTKEDMRLERR